MFRKSKTSNSHSSNSIIYKKKLSKTIMAENLHKFQSLTVNYKPHCSSEHICSLWLILFSIPCISQYLNHEPNNCVHNEYLCSLLVPRFACWLLMLDWLVHSRLRNQRCVKLKKVSYIKPM